MVDRIKFVHWKIIVLKRELGPVYHARLKQIRNNLGKTFKQERKQEAREEIEKVIQQEHILSAKEKVSRVHYSSLLQGLLQFGLCHANRGHDL
jgi:hypothetical protein